ncbi:MAG: transmembrane prediction [Pirellulaceae bacterium]
MLTVSPTIWALHFLLSYVTAAVWCAKDLGADGSLGGARTAIAVYTGIALIGIAITGWIGYRRHTFGDGSLPHDADTPEDRHRFMGFAILLLSVLSAVATLFVASVAIFIGNCD